MENRIIARLKNVNEDIQGAYLENINDTIAPLIQAKQQAILNKLGIKIQDIKKITKIENTTKVKSVILELDQMVAELKMIGWL